MSEIKLTKNGLREQQQKLAQLSKYLPTLQLKKAMLQAQVQEARLILEEAQRQLEKATAKTKQYVALLGERTSVSLDEIARVRRVDKTYENIAGVEVPQLNAIEFAPLKYSLFATPAWVDGAILGLRHLSEQKVRVGIALEKKQALEKELHEVSIRVNLFEKILIPKTRRHIRSIRVFLGDQELAAVARAKVAKEKIQRAAQKATMNAVK